MQVRAPAPWSIPQGLARFQGLHDSNLAQQGTGTRCNSTKRDGVLSGTRGTAGQRAVAGTGTKVLLHRCRCSEPPAEARSAQVRGTRQRAGACLDAGVLLRRCRCSGPFTHARRTQDLVRNRPLQDRAQQSIRLQDRLGGRLVDLLDLLTNCCKDKQLLK